MDQNRMESSEMNKKMSLDDLNKVAGGELPVQMNGEAHNPKFAVGDRVRESYSSGNGYYGDGTVVQVGSYNWEGIYDFGNVYNVRFDKDGHIGSFGEDALVKI